jgi:hypothetical protein
VSAVNGQGLDLFPPVPPPSARLSVVDLAGESLDRRLAATTLQGQANSSGEAVLYLLAAHWDQFWLDRLVETGAIEGYSRLSVDEAFATFASRYRSIVVYDSQVPASMNVATALASVESGVVAGEEDAATLAGGRPIIDLRGRFRSNAEAYQWALEEIWPRLSHRVIAAYHPTATSHMLRDYLVARRVMPIWVTSEERSDGQVAVHADELAVFEELLRVSPENIPMVGFITSGPDAGLTEYGGVGLAGEYGKFSVVCDFMSNSSLLSGVPTDLAGALQSYWSRTRRPAPELDPTKVYLAICIVESGDAPGYWQSRQYQVWEDPMQGRVPINWSVGPAVYELLPPVFAYFVERASPLDHFYTAISGAGYVHPYRGFLDASAAPEAAWNRYLELTAQSMALLGSPELGLYTDAWRPFDRELQDPTTRRFAEGVPGLEMLLMGMGRDEGFDERSATYVLPPKDVVVSHVLTRWPHDHHALSRDENIAWLVEDIRDQTPADRPGFMAVMALSWSHDASSLSEVLDRLGPDYIPVLLPEFRSLWREARG